MFQSRVAYSLMMVIAAIIATWILRRQQRHWTIPAGDRWAILAGGFVGATFAAKLPFLLFASETGQSANLAWFGDGKTVLWGLAGGYVGVEVGKWMVGYRQRTGDTFVVAIAIAIAIGRLGCFLFGCCFGTPTDVPWSVCFANADDGGTVPRHPTQVYEMLFHLLFALVAYVGIGANKRMTSDVNWLRGNWMPVYLLSYCVYRFISEEIRPEPVIAGGLTFYQWSSLAIGAAMSGILIWRFGYGDRNKVAPEQPLATDIRT